MIQGTLFYPNGQKFVGNFLNDLMQGQGIKFAANGSILQKGQWKAGTFIS